MTRIRAVGTLPLSITDEHEVLTSDSKTSFWFPASKVVPRENYLMIPRIKGTLDYPLLDLSPYTTKPNIVTGKGYPMDFPLNFDSSWLVGLYLAEGSVQEEGIRFSLGRHEKDLAKRLVEVIQSLGYKGGMSGRGSTVKVKLDSRVLGRAFRSLCGDSCYNKAVPHFILDHKDLKLSEGLLKGYLEGDGYTGDRYISAPTASKRLALSLQLLAARPGILLKVYYYPARGWRKVQGRNVFSHERWHLHAQDRKLFKIMGLDRKVGLYLSRICWPDYILTPVTEVGCEPYSGEVWNLGTTDQTYLASNLVVHNCQKRLYKLKQASA